MTLVRILSIAQHLLVLSLLSSNGIIGGDRPAVVSAAQSFEDGGEHTLSEDFDNGPLELRSSTSLTLEPGTYAVTFGKLSNDNNGDAATIRLTMSSTLIANGGIISGADGHSGGNSGTGGRSGGVASAGVHVGGASRAEFYAGAVVKGGNADASATELAEEEHEEESRRLLAASSSGGGDALVAKYFGSTIVTHGGTFVAGRGGVPRPSSPSSLSTSTSSSDGHSILVSNEASAEIHGGTFAGSWLASDRGSIQAFGCLSRAGDRLVGTLEDGSSLDVRIEESRGGVVVVQEPEDGSGCRKSQGDGGHHPSGAVVVGRGGLAMGWIGSALGALVWTML